MVALRSNPTEPNSTNWVRSSPDFAFVHGHRVRGQAAVTDASDGPGLRPLSLRSPPIPAGRKGPRVQDRPAADTSAVGLG